MTLLQKQGLATRAIQEIRQDPSMMLALGTGSVLAAFLMTVHACCLGLATPQHLAALLQICTTVG